MNEPLFTQTGTDLSPRRRFWTGVPPVTEPAMKRPDDRERRPWGFAFTWSGIASRLLGSGRRRRPEPAG